MFGNILIGLLMIALFLVLTARPYSTKWGYYPISAIGSALVLLLILSLLGLI